MRRLLGFFVLVVARLAYAEPRVVSLETDPNLGRAMTTALASWHATVTSSPTPVPGRDLDDAIRTAHRIARNTAARIVVWISPEPSGPPSLWIYDDGTRGIVVRPLPAPPPYDEVTAAAIALTVKTVLRDVLEKPARPPALTTEVDAFPTAPKAPSLHSVRMLVLGGLRIPTHASDLVDTRFGGEVTWFFRRQIGLGAGVDFGLNPVLIEHKPYFTGTATDTVLVPLAFRWRVPVRPWLQCELGVGWGIHFGRLEGSAPLVGLSGSVSRTDISLETTIAVELAWKLLRIGPLFGTSFRAHYERYSVNDLQVFDVPATQMFYALRVGVELP